MWLQLSLKKAEIQLMNEINSKHSLLYMVNGNTLNKTIQIKVETRLTEDVQLISLNLKNLTVVGRSPVKEPSPILIVSSTSDEESSLLVTVGSA